MSPDSADVTLVDGDRVAIEDGARPATIGRYVVIDRIGMGGMGIVYAAWDPQLDRRVALKVLFPRGGDEDRLGEARALARFSHPDVVSIYDAGTADGRVWLAMELLEGLTLDRWARLCERSWPEIMRVLLAAGRGLAAVHDAGLVHRDVKPSNVFVGHDGRVSLMDFGLAATEAMMSTQRGFGRTSVLGTLAYMAPEQHDEGIVDARADQFAFCVLAWELAYGEHPFGDDPAALALAMATHEEPRSPTSARGVPAWMHDVVRRGLAPRPVDRHASMTALLAEIRRGRRRRRGRDVALACVAGLAIVGAVVGAGRIRERRRMAECRESAAAIELTWPGPRGEVRDRLRTQLSSLDVARSERSIAALDHWSAQWREQYEYACTPAVLHEELERRNVRIACFSRDVTEVGALVDTLLGDAGVVDARWLEASAQLPETSRCLEDRLSSEDAAPPLQDQGEIAEVQRMAVRARALRVTGHLGDSLALAERARTEAVRLGWPSLSARVGLELARSLEMVGQPRRGAEVGEVAYFEAVGAGDDETAAAIAGMLGFLLADRLAHVREAEVWIRHAYSRLDRLGSERLRPALQLDEALVAQADGDYARARTLREATLAEYERRYGVDDPMTAIVAMNLAVTYEHLGELDRALESNRRAAASLEAAYGPEYPELAVIRLNLGTVLFRLGEFDEAEVKYREALPLIARSLGEDHAAYLMCWSNLAAMAWRKNDLVAAREAFQKAEEIGSRTLGEGHPQYAGILYNLGLVERSLGDDDAAERMLLRSLTTRDRIRGRDYPRVAATLAQLAYLHWDQRKDELAWDEAHRALAMVRNAEPPSDNEPRILTLVGQIEQERGQLHDAAKRYAEAIELFGDDDLQSVESLVGAAEVALRLGDVAVARRHASRAAEILGRIPITDEIGARGWLVHAQVLWMDGERARARASLARGEAYAGGLGPEDARGLPAEIARARRVVR